MSSELCFFPRLRTYYQGPLSTLEKTILTQAESIEAWFKVRWQETPALITTSVDLRFASYKISPVDTNIFPAGFNNLHQDVLSLCAQAFKTAILSYLPTGHRILILPENHTRNQFYLQSLAVLRDCLMDAGFIVHFGSLNTSIQTPMYVPIEHRPPLIIEPLSRKNDVLYVGEYTPCFVLLNHDLSSGIPDILLNLAQPIYPSQQLGWATRFKSRHFLCLDHVMHEFSDLIECDPWLMNPYFSVVEDVDFMAQQGLEKLAKVVDEIRLRIQQKYQMHGINTSPFIVVKADNGTYGMSVMMVKQGDELLHLNRKQRTHMATRKGGEKVTRVLIQEGVASLERLVNQTIAEPVIYLVGESVIGGFYRAHADKGAHDNLNTPGMFFEPMTLETPAFEPYLMSRTLDISHRSYVYGVIARLAALAAARES